MRKYILIFTIVFSVLLIASHLHTQSVTSAYPNLKKHEFNQELVIALPQTADIKNEQQFSGSDLRYSVYFEEPQYSLRGYIQLWQLEDIKDFLASSKENSMFEYTSYGINTVTIHNLRGIISNWTASFSELRTISGIEYWLKKDSSSNVLRISFLTTSDSFSEEQLCLQEEILQTLQWPIP